MAMAFRPLPHLFFNPFPVGFAGRSDLLGYLDFRSGWPRWGILNARGIRAGGHVQTGGVFLVAIRGRGAETDVLLEAGIKIYLNDLRLDVQVSTLPCLAILF
jgi:hypothetical protein